MASALPPRVKRDAARHAGRSLDFLPKRGLRLIVVGFLALGVTLLLAPRDWFPPWFFPRLTGVGSFGYALLLAVPGLVFRTEDRSTSKDARAARRSLTRLQLALGASSLLGIAGTLGLFRLHRVGFPYDKVMHLGVPMLMTIALGRFVRRWYDVPVRTALITATAIVSLSMVAWELTEFLSDAFLGTSAFGQEGRDVELDTSLDLGLGMIGTALGVAMVRSWKRLRAA